MLKMSQKFLGIGLDSEKYILESDAMIMKDERAKYARDPPWFVRDAIQEEVGKFEDTLFEVQEEPEQEDKFREQFYVMLSKIQEKYPKATRRSVLEHCSEKLDIPFNTVASTTSRCNTGKYLRQKAQILEEMESMVQGRKEHKADGLDALQVELSALRDEWYHLTGKHKVFITKWRDYYSVARQQSASSRVRPRLINAWRQKRRNWVIKRWLHH